MEVLFPLPISRLHNQRKILTLRPLPMLFLRQMSPVYQQRRQMSMLIRELFKPKTTPWTSQQLLMKMHELKRLDYDILAEREAPRTFWGMDNVTCDTAMCYELTPIARKILRGGECDHFVRCISIA